MDVDFFDKPTGIDYNLQPSRYGTNAATEVKNLCLTPPGFYRTRNGTERVGEVLPEDLCAIVQFQGDNGIEYLFRFLKTKIQLFEGGSWVDIAAVPTPAFTIDTHIAWTAWSGFLIWSDGTTMNVIDPVAKTSAAVAAGPGARHLTTFNGRVIASYTFETATQFTSRMRWSVKNDYTNWTGLGSGFEDFYTSPGGSVDVQFGLYPVNDQQAIVVRSNSLWMCQPTLDFDAPFSISILTTALHSDAPFSIATIPSVGIIYYTRDDVKLVTVGNVQSVGTQVRTGLLTALDQVEGCIGVFDSYNNEYRLLFPKHSFNANYLNSNTFVWRYNLPHQHWSRDELIGEVRTMTFINFKTNQTIDQLTGTIDGLTGNINSLGIGFSASQPKMVYGHGVSGGYVTQEKSSASDDFGNNVTAVIQTGLVQPSVKATQIIAAVQAEIYVSDHTGTTVNLYYSVDFGGSWTLVSAKTLVDGQNLLRWHWQKNAKYVEFKLEFVEQQGVALQRFFVTAVPGPRLMP